MTSFGTTKDGTQVHKISLAAGDLRVDLLTHGARVQSVRLAGVAHDLTLGSEDLADLHGPTECPVANVSHWVVEAVFSCNVESVKLEISLVITKTCLSMTSCNALRTETGVFVDGTRTCGGQ